MQSAVTALCHNHYQLVAAGTVLVVCSPTFQLSNFPASWFVGVVAGGGGCVGGYSEALMRISERGCIRAAE